MPHGYEQLDVIPKPAPAHHSTGVSSRGPIHGIALMFDVKPAFLAAASSMAVAIAHTAPAKKKIIAFHSGEISRPDDARTDNSRIKNLRLVRIARMTLMIFQFCMILFSRIKNLAARGERAAFWLARLSNGPLYEYSIFSVMAQQIAASPAARSLGCTMPTPMFRSANAGPIAHV